MRRTFLYICLALLCGAGILYLIQLESGYVLISLGRYSIEMSFWVALVLLALAQIVVLSAIWVMAKSKKLISSGFSGIVSVRGRAGQKQTSRGLIDFMEGNWKQAKKQLLKSVKQAETPLVNYLAAARSAYELGEYKEAFELLHNAEQCDPNSELAVALTQARMQLLDKKYEQCVATLERAKKKAPKHPVVLDLLKQSYMALRDWPNLQAILPELRRQKVFTQEAMEDIENTIYTALITDAGEQAKRLTTEKQRLEKLEKAWQSIPADIQKQAVMVETYVWQLLQNQGDAIAEQLLRKTLNRNWSAKLVRLFGLVNAEDRKKQLLCAEDWLKERPGNAALMLTAGRLCLRNEIWGKARDYFESSLRLQHDPETFAELARLLAHLGEHERSTEYYQQGLLMMTNGLPELPMPNIQEVPASSNLAAR
jgi:HemY protein